MSSLIDRYRDEVFDAARTVPGDQVLRAARALLEVHRRGGAVYVLCPPEEGEGASRLADELERAGGAGLLHLRLVRLFGDRARVPAWENDWAYEDAYAEQMRGRLRPGDAVVAVSGRGQGQGMAHALQAARSAGAATLAIVGCDGGTLLGQADICLHVRCQRTEQIEDAQMMLAHLLSISLQHLVDESASAGEGEGRGGHEG